VLAGRINTHIYSRLPLHSSVNISEVIWECTTEEEQTKLQLSTVPESLVEVAWQRRNVHKNKICPKKKASQKEKWSGQSIWILHRNAPYIIHGFHTEMPAFQMQTFVEHIVIEFDSKNKNKSSISKTLVQHIIRPYLRTAMYTQTYRSGMWIQINKCSLSVLRWHTRETSFRGY